MKSYLYKILLSLLRVFVYVKRTVLWIVYLFVPVYSAIGTVYRNTIGFRLYKLGFLCKKYWQKWRIPFDSRFAEIIGRRGTLQIVFLLVAFIILIPHSVLYTTDINIIPGRDTILFNLVGPGELEVGVEEVEASTNEFVPRDTRSWRVGAVQPDMVSPNLSSQPGYTNTDISGITVGGTALTKPTIISGAVPPSLPGTPPVLRSELAYYEVKPGDVIINIAREYNISVDTILWANNLTARSYIRPGDKLIILPVDGVIHTIKKDETISKIARQYSADQSALIAFNNLDPDGRSLTIGQNIIVPGGRKAQSQPLTTPRPPAAGALRPVAAPPPSVTAPAGTRYLWPTNVQRITQYYGLRHTGIDIAGPVGSPLYAARAGTVIKSQCGWNGGYGCYIIIDHGGGVQSLYGHASTLYVSVGDEVTQGQTIAAMGSTGRSTGPHVHFEVRINGRRANPLTYVK